MSGCWARSSRASVQLVQPNDRTVGVDCLPAWADVYDFEAAARDDRWVVMHHDDRFLRTGAKNAVPRARTERPRDIDHQASPPFSRKR
jgi:hypothetical protein